MSDAEKRNGAPLATKEMTPPSGDRENPEPSGQRGDLEKRAIPPTVVMDDPQGQQVSFDPAPVSPPGPVPVDGITPAMEVSAKGQTVPGIPLFAPVPVPVSELMPPGNPPPSAAAPGFPVSAAAPSQGLPHSGYGPHHPGAPLSVGYQGQPAGFAQGYPMRSTPRAGGGSSGLIVGLVAVLILLGGAIGALLLWQARGSQTAEREEPTEVIPLEPAAPESVVPSEPTAPEQPAAGVEPTPPALAPEPPPPTPPAPASPKAEQPAPAQPTPTPPVQPPAAQPPAAQPPAAQPTTPQTPPAAQPPATTEQPTKKGGKRRRKRPEGLEI